MLKAWIQKHRGKPLLFHDKCPGFFYVHYTTHRTYSFTSHSKDEAIMVKCLAQGHKRCDQPGWDSNPHSDNTRTWVQCTTKNFNNFLSGLSRTNWSNPRERDDQVRGLDRSGDRGMKERRYSGRSRQDSWHEDGGMEEMPEWTMDDPFDGDIGTFDSSGAFCSTKVRLLLLFIKAELLFFKRIFFLAPSVREKTIIEN